MTVPYPVVRKLVLLSVLGYVVLTIGVVSGAAWWQYRTDSKQEQIIEAVITAQEESCTRGNTVRMQLREDNEEAIRTTAGLLAGPGLSKNQRVVYRRALKSRVERRKTLITYDCGTIRKKWFGE